MKNVDPNLAPRYWNTFKNPNSDSDINPAFAEIENVIIKDKLVHDREDRSYDPKIFSPKKVIVSGDVLEEWNFEKPVRYGTRPKKFYKKHGCYHVHPETGEIIGEDIEDPNHVPYDPVKAREDNSRRAKWEFRRTVISNFDNGSKFFTLTFRDGSVNDVKDVAECNQAFRDFIKRMRRRYSDFKYCAVIEFQDDPTYRKDGIPRGAVHYHVVANIPFVAHALLEMIWGNGFVDITGIDHVDNVGAYISKYMAKNGNDPRLMKKKSYLTSHNITRPVVLYGADAEEIASEFADEQKKVFTNSYESEYQGKTVYKEYNLKR